MVIVASLYQIFIVGRRKDDSLLASDDKAHLLLPMNSYIRKANDLREP